MHWFAVFVTCTFYIVHQTRTEIHFHCRLHSTVPHTSCSNI